MSTCIRAIGAAALFLFASSTALAQQVELLWLGHSTFRVTTVGGKVIVIDPFLKRNPRTPAKYKDLKVIGKVDLILVTHGHGDHINDLTELASTTGATVVANFELANNFVALGLVEASKMIAMNKGGTITPIGPGIRIHMVPAEHTSSVDLAAHNMETKGGARHLEGGAAVGYVIAFENGFKIYHMGDTYVFGDMALISKFYQPDLALVPIGGHYGMDPEAAAYAMRELVHPKQAIPIHYGTFPLINHTPAEFKAAMGNTPIKVLDMKPGEVLKF